MAMKQMMLNALTTPNTIENYGGWSSLLVPRKVNPLGAGVILGGMTAVNVAKEGLKLYNVATTGKVHYQGGPARMTSNFTSGAVEAMNRVSQGDYQAFSEMASAVMTPNSLGGKIETYGVTPKFVSAIYGMGG